MELCALGVLEMLPFSIAVCASLLYPPGTLANSKDSRTKLEVKRPNLASNCLTLEMENTSFKKGKKKGAVPPGQK